MASSGLPAAGLCRYPPSPWVQQCGVGVSDAAHYCRLEVNDRVHDSAGMSCAVCGEGRRLGISQCDGHARLRPRMRAARGSFFSDVWWRTKGKCVCVRAPTGLCTSAARTRKRVPRSWLTGVVLAKEESVRFGVPPPSHVNCFARSDFVASIVKNGSCDAPPFSNRSHSHLLGAQFANKPLQSRLRLAPALSGVACCLERRARTPSCSLCAEEPRWFHDESQTRQAATRSEVAKEPWGVGGEAQTAPLDSPSGRRSVASRASLGRPSGARSACRNEPVREERARGTVVGRRAIT